MAVRRLAAVLAILAGAAAPAMAETYKWIDAKGVVNYSNKPPPSQAAKQQVVEERISVVASDPSIAPAVKAMNARAERRAEYEEADWERRQNLLLSSQVSYAGADCPYRANCDRSYGVSDYYYYPYAYGGRVFNAVKNRPPHVAHHHRAHVSPHGSGGNSGRGSRSSGPMSLK